MSKPRAIVIRHNGGELANQLWNFASVYAYALESKRELENPTFFEYAEYFSLPRTNLFTDILFFKTYRIASKVAGTKLTKRLWRKAYSVYAKLVMRAHADSVIRSGYDANVAAPVYLSPTKEDAFVGKESVYFDGWLFRNPKGLAKYRTDIVSYFKPKEKYIREARELLEASRKSYKHIIGIHIRQGDYRTFKGGAYFVSNERAREIALEYLKMRNLDKDLVQFVICSNEPVDTSVWQGLHTVVSKGSAVNDLFLLSQTDEIIASDSTYSAFASYCGNIPLVVMKKEKMDWEYYTTPRISLENPYSTLVFY